MKLSSAFSDTPTWRKRVLAICSVLCAGAEADTASKKHGPRPGNGATDSTHTGCVDQNLIRFVAIRPFKAVDENARRVRYTAIFYLVNGPHDFELDNATQVVVPCDEHDTGQD